MYDYEFYIMYGYSDIAAFADEHKFLDYNTLQEIAMWLSGPGCNIDMKEPWKLTDLDHINRT